MKTLSYKELSSAENSKLDIKNFSFAEFSDNENENQAIIDSLYDKSKEMNVHKIMPTEGFKLDEEVKKNLPDPKKEVALFEKRVQEETEKRLKIIEKQAYENGFQKAKEEGYNAGLAEIKKNVAPYEQEIVETAKNLRKVLEEIYVKKEALLINIIVSITEKIIMADYKKDINTLRSMISGIIKLTGEHEDIEVRLSKSDHERMSAFSKELIDELGLKNGLRLEADHTIQKGGCKVITNLGLINATLEHQFLKLRSEFEARIPNVTSNLVEEAAIPTKSETAAIPQTEIKSDDIANIVKEKMSKND